MIHRRERPSELPDWSIRPRHLVASTMESRTPRCPLSQRPMISSDVPRGPTRGYTSAAPTFQRGEPAEAVASAVLKPVGVELRLQSVRVAEQGIQSRLAVPSLRLEGVVVIDELQPLRFQAAGEVNRFRGEAFVPFNRRV